MIDLLSQEDNDATIWEATTDHSWMNWGYMATQEQVVEEQEWEKNAAGHSLK